MTVGPSRIASNIVDTPRPLRLVFAHDHRFILHRGQYLSAGQFSAGAWERYLEVCDELVIVAREGVAHPDEDIAQYNVASRPRVAFRFVPNLAGVGAYLVRQARAQRIMDELIATTDGVIARLPSETGLLAIEAARRHGKPWAVEVVGCAWDALWNYGTWQGKLYAPVMYRRMRRAAAGSPFALYVTRTFLQDRYPCEAGHAVACSDVDIGTPRDDVRLDRLGRDPAPTDRPLVFGLIGTLHGRYKGIQTVFAALSEYRSRLPPCEFRILGGGDPTRWRDLAQRLGVQDLVRFDGVLPSGEPVLRWLDDIDVYLQPSLQEGLPRALIEAMSRASPALGSRIAGIPELLDDDCLHAPGDAGALGRLMLRAAGDPHWLRTLSERNWRRAHEYSREILQGRRGGFWRHFAAACRCHAQ